MNAGLSVIIPFTLPLASVALTILTGAFIAALNFSRSVSQSPMIILTAHNPLSSTNGDCG